MKQPLIQSLAPTYSPPAPHRIPLIRILSTLLFTILILFTFLSIPCSANDIVPNIEGFTSGLNTGTNYNCWPAAADGKCNEGFRAYLVDTETFSVVSNVVDITRTSVLDVVLHGNYATKFNYKNGTKLSLLCNAYSSITYDGSVGFPSILNGNGTSIRTWATDGYVLDWFAHQCFKDYLAAGVGHAITSSSYCTTDAAIDKCDAFNELISGKYKLVLEPLMVIRYLGNTYAITGTEFALLSQKSVGTKVITWAEGNTASLYYGRVYESDPKAYYNDVINQCNDIITRTTASGSNLGQFFNGTAWENVSGSTNTAAARMRNEQKAKATPVKDSAQAQLNNINSFSFYPATINNCLGSTFTKNTYNCLRLVRSDLGLTYTASDVALSYIQS